MPALPAPVAPLAEDPRGAAVVVDFDGSLAPVVADPGAARPLPDAPEVLATLASRVALVAVVSGRPVAFLAEHLPVSGVALVGQYGLERRVGTGVVVDPRAAPHRAAVAEVAAAAEAAWPRLRVERKGAVAVTFHWREHPELAGDVGAWAEAEAARRGLTAHAGRRSIELRPPVPVDKGTVVEELLAGHRVACFAGDDRGDLPAFDALDRMVADGRLRHAARIGVRSPEEPPELVARADLEVDGPRALLDLLRALAAAVG